MSHSHTPSGPAPTTPAHPVTFVPVQRAGDQGVTLVARDLGYVEFSALNDSGVSGFAELSRQGNLLTVHIHADGLEPNQVHIQHIHGRLSPAGLPLESKTPSLARDLDGDGFVELAEGAPAYGPILVNLTMPPNAGLGGFPTAPDGSIRYFQTFDLGAGQGLAAGITAEQVFPLELREMVIHGLSVDGSAGAGTGGEIDGTAGYKLVLPVASGEIEAVGSRLIGGAGADRLFGNVGDDSIRAGGGDDTIRAGAGDDQVQGGLGHDAIRGEAGADRLLGNEGNDTITGGTGIDVLIGGAGNDILAGDSGNVTGRGDLSADVLNGGSGDDTLLIGEGLDVVSGGAGADRFAFRFNNPQSPAAAGTAPAFAAIEDFSAAQDSFLFDAMGVGNDAAGANFLDGSGGGGQVSSFYQGAAAGSAGQGVMVLTDTGFASGALAVQAAQGEQAGDMVIYFNTTVNVASLLVVSAPDTAVSIARFTDITDLDGLAGAGLSASDFIFA
ncbi:calcium-binding protein [Falsiroseomonas selenitidurans]|uniref:Calcium-binding protein n=1 Tax=Falsiroseomonas selenitidurans TaxID=2716335 RepID=A0ABX1EC10_9PROT|nr:calcium-binding protein [Falsiroseomonas selenitidurans]NKC34350.1 calcium-binding protein [Falsiroseomonas selenitidurans]